MAIWYRYTLWKDCPHLVNTSITTYIYLYVCVWEHVSFTLSKFRLHNTVLTTTVTMFYIRSSDLIRLTAESLYPFSNLSLFPPTLAPGNHFSSLHFYKSDFIFIFHRLFFNRYKPEDSCIFLPHFALVSDIAKQLLSPHTIYVKVPVT